MIKWFNRQKPITLGFITAITSSIAGLMFLHYVGIIGITVNSVKFVGVMFTFVLFFSWLLFHQGEKSSDIFKEIDELYYRAKKVKTKTELLEVTSDYIDLRNRADNQGHYAQLNIIKGIVETKKEYL